MSLIDSVPNLKRQGVEYEDCFALFLQSREAMGVSPKTLLFYRERLSKFIGAVDYKQVTRGGIGKYLNSIPPNKYGLGTRHASYRAIKTFYRWLHSEYGFINPIEGMPAPILGKPLLPSLEREQVFYLIDKVSSVRDKVIIALFTESGLRLSELANIKPEHINWASRTIRVVGKGRKEAFAAFGELTEKYLTVWLEQYTPHGNIWGLSESGIFSMLRRLELNTGLPCNPHTFRRTFACLLRKAGVDTMTIRDLGRWESIQMVERYTRSVTFLDSLKYYKPPLS
jgi:integrase/recombinase XerC